MKPGIGICFFFLFNTAVLCGQGLMESLTIEQGLSQGMIFDLCQTRDGFLWIATKDGLNRYDGYNFKVFSNDLFNPYSLAENTVTALFEDSRAWLWVVVDSKGLDLYDPHTGRFHHFSLSFNRNTQGASFGITRIFEAPDGSIYLLQKGNGLVHIAIPPEWENGLPDVPDLSQLTNLTFFPMGQFQLEKSNGDVFFSAIEAREEGAVWVYTQERPYQVELSKGFVRPLDQVSSTRSSKGADIWGIIPNGLIRFQAGQATLRKQLPGPQIVTTFAKPAANGFFWVAVSNQLWHLASGETPDFSRPHWIVDEDISAVTTDRNGNIWIGTQGYGLRKINPRKQLFNKGAAGTSIWGLWRDTRGRYFCKLVNEVRPYDPVTGEIGTQRAFPDGPKRVLDMYIDPSSGMYWLLGRGEEEGTTAELRSYNPENGQSKAYLFPFESPPQGGQNASAGKPGQWFKPYVYARLLRSHDGYLWATGLNCQLVRFDPQTARFDLFDYAASFGKKASTARAIALAEDGNGTIWIGTQLGLVKCSPNGQSFDFELLQANPDNPQGLNNNSIACLLPDPANPRGILWVGTKGGGINRLDLHSGLFKHITMKDGLPDKVVYGILPGSQNELWCSTNRGLVKLSPNEPEGMFNITAFTAGQGLQDNEFNTQAFFKAANGELLFGGVSGLNRFFPDEVQLDTTPPPVFLVGLRINHQAVINGDPFSPLTEPLENIRELDLSHHQNNLSFEFAALDFTAPEKNRYRYRLVGADPDWVETGTSRFAHFTHLAPGRYTLYVEGSNGEGAWQALANPVAITIWPPWWRSNLAYALYLALLLWMVWQGYRFQLRRIQLREQLASELRESARVRALEQMKTNFFNNITHEFRTPLTLILEPARRILVKTREPEVAVNASRIEANSLRLLDMVNELLDLAKLESGSMGLDLRQGDFSKAVRAVFHSFLPLAEQRGLNLSISETEAPSGFMFDLKKTELIINNLLSNALKFTPAGGSVHIHICQGAAPEQVHLSHRQAGVRVAVSDTGIGIPQEHLGKIFNRFYQVDDHHAPRAEGTGIGLALSRELAGLMGGSLDVQSEEGRGSVFTLWLPALTTAPAQDAYDDKVVTTIKEGQPAARPADEEQPLVLLIEDNAELRAFIKQCISSQWQVAEASNGEEGIKKAQDLIPDLVISDLMMPIKDGYEVCDELKNNELTAHIPVMLLTAKSAMDAKIKGLRTGADDYLTKPFNTDELMARMENLVEQRRRLRQRYAQWAPANEAMPDVPEHLSAHDREFLQRFTSVLDENLSDENMSVEELARKMFISRVQLHRKLKALTDRNVTDFVRDYRLERAMAMLRNREGLVYEVAYKVGFSSNKYFSRAFKEKFGVSPSKVV